MRETIYTCDKCGKRVEASLAVRINISMVEGKNPQEKKTLDLCPKHFAALRDSITNWMEKKTTSFVESEDNKVLSTYTPPASEEVEATPAVRQILVGESGGSIEETKSPLEVDQAECTKEDGQNHSSCEQSDEKAPDAVNGETHSTEDEGHQLAAFAKEATNGSSSREEATDRELYHEVEAADSFTSQEASEESEGEDTSLKTGPIGPAEKDRIFRLYIIDKLSPEEIAAKLHRSPKGVKRSITCAKSSGEFDTRKTALLMEENRERVKSRDFQEDDSSIREDYEGSGASNVGVQTDSYTEPPKTEVIGGKRYDVGGILALARCGWSVKDIANEKHYDEAIVSSICRRYNDSLKK